MHKCTCADCGRTFMTFELSWWCDDCRKKRFEKHNEKKKPTNADRIRTMSDEELANHLYLFHGLEEQIKFCQNLPACEALLNTEDGIPEEKCVGCLLAWLKQSAEETNAPT